MGKKQNKQRYKCKDCGLLFTSENKSVSKSNKFVWFEKKTIGRRTLEQLGKLKTAFKMLNTIKLRLDRTTLNTSD